MKRVSETELLAIEDICEGTRGATPPTIGKLLAAEVRRLQGLLCEAHHAATLARYAQPYDWAQFVDVALEVEAIRAEARGARDSLLARFRTTKNPDE